MNQDDLNRIRGHLSQTKVAEMFDIEKSLHLWSQHIKLGVLPPNSVINFDLTFDFSEFDLLEQDRFQIPDNTTIHGSLVLKNFECLRLPRNLTITRDLVICSTHLKELPLGLRVGGILDLMGSTTKIKIPPCTTVGMWVEGGC